MTDRDLTPKPEFTAGQQQQKLRAFYAACPPIGLFREMFIDEAANNLAQANPDKLVSEQLDDAIGKAFAKTTMRKPNELIKKPAKTL